MTKNDITGDKLISKKNTDNYRDNYDAIFNKKVDDVIEKRFHWWPLLLLPLLVWELSADEIKHKFKSPSFSGVGTSSHYLTIDSQEVSKKDALKAEIKALADAAKREEENTTLARFIRNLESRIYAQLSRQLVENLFGETPSDSGVLTLEGNTIEYNVVDGIITLNITDSDGNTTTISLPIGSFTF